MSLPKIGVEAVVDNLDGYKKGINAINSSNEKAVDSVEKTVKKFDLLGAVTNKLSDVFDEAFGTLIANVVTRAMDTVFNAIGRVIGAIGNLIGSVFDNGVQFSSTMANISAVTKITGKDLTQLSKDLIEIGANSGAGPQSVADAYYDVAGGVSEAAQRLPVLEAAIAASEAGQANLKATTQGVIATMNAYGSEVLSAARIGDILTQTTAVGTRTLDEYVAALGPLSGLAASQKIKFEELGAAMAFLTQKGFPAEQAATALQAAITQLTRSTPQLNRALRVMGEKSIESSLANHGLAGTLDLIQQGAKKTGQNLTTLLGDVNAMKAATALGNDEFAKYFDTFVDGVDGATAAARELQRADVSFQLKLIGSRFSAIGLSISQAVLPAFNKFLTFINDAFNKIDWKKIGGGLDKLGEKLGQSVGNLVGELAEKLSSVDWDAVATGISDALSGIGDFITNIDWATVVAGIQQFIEGIVSAGKTVGEVIGGISKFFSDMGAQVSLTLSTLGLTWESAVNAAGTIFNNVGVLIAGAAGGIHEAVSGIVEGVGATWNDWFGATGKIPSAVANTIEAAKALLMNAPQGFIDAVVGIVNAISAQWNFYFGPDGSIALAVSDAFTKAKGIIDGAVATVTAAIQGIVDAVGAVWDGLFGPAGTLSTAVSSAWDTVKGIVEGAVAGIRAAFAAVGTAIMAALRPALDFVQSLANAMGSVLAGAASLGISLPGRALGGNVQDGITLAGERGAEAIVKHGSRVSVIPANKTRAMLASSGASHPAVAHRALNLDSYKPANLLSGASNAVAGVMPQPVPIYAGSSDTYNSTTNNNNSNITLNGVQNGESAMQRMAMIKAARGV